MPSSENPTLGRVALGTILHTLCGLLIEKALQPTSNAEAPKSLYTLPDDLIPRDVRPHLLKSKVIEYQEPTLISIGDIPRVMGRGGRHEIEVSFPIVEEPGAIRGSGAVDRYLREHVFQCETCTMSSVDHCVQYANVYASTAVRVARVMQYVPGAEMLIHVCDNHYRVRLSRGTVFIRLRSGVCQDSNALERLVARGVMDGSPTLARAGVDKFGWFVNEFMFAGVSPELIRRAKKVVALVPHAELAFERDDSITWDEAPWPQ
jgi:hypothetical protein